MFQHIQQTHDQTVAMYNKLPKKQLIEMLIACNKSLQSRPLLPEISPATRLEFFQGSNIMHCDHYFHSTDAHWQRCMHCGMIKPL